MALAVAKCFRLPDLSPYLVLYPPNLFTDGSFAVRRKPPSSDLTRIVYHAACTFSHAPLLASSLALSPSRFLRRPLHPVQSVQRRHPICFRHRRIIERRIDKVHDAVRLALLRDDRLTDMNDL